MKATLGLICLVGCAIFVAEAQTVNVKLCYKDKDCRSPNLYCHTMTIAGVEISTCRAYLRDGNVCMPNITAKCPPKSKCLDFYIGNSTYYKTCQKKTEDTTTSAPVEITTSAPVEITTSAPVEITTSAPVEITTSAPVEITTSAPVEITTSAPIEITTSVNLDTSLGPDDITTVVP